MFRVSWLTDNTDDVYEYINFPVYKKLNFIFSTFIPDVKQEYCVNKLSDQVCGFLMKYKLISSEINKEFLSEFYLDINDREYPSLPEKEKIRMLQDKEVEMRVYVYNKALEYLEKEFLGTNQTMLTYTTWHRGSIPKNDNTEPYFSCDVSLDVLENPELLDEKEWALIRNCDMSYVPSFFSEEDEILLYEKFNSVFSLKNICHINIEFET